METNTQKKRKFNIVDLIFILILIAAITIVAVKFLFNKSNENDNENNKMYECILVLHSDDVPETALKDVKVGDELADEREKKIGEITDIKIAEARTHGIDSEGRDVLTPKEDYVSVDITVKAAATVNDHSLIINDIKYFNNASYTYISGVTKLWLRIAETQVTDVEVTEEAEDNASSANNN